MELKDTCIYDYIKDYLNEIYIVNYNKGQYIAHSNENFEGIYFILDGEVKVECITNYGKSFLVDELSENEFVGKISYMYEQHLLCDITAMSKVTLLKIDKDTFKKLQKNSEFLKIFLFKTSKRIYCMYKKLMLRDLFSLEEIFAFYMLKNSKNDIFEYKSMYSLCKTLSMSRKSLYNTINKLIEKGYIRKDKNSLTILDKEYLYKTSISVREFYEIDHCDCKFDIKIPYPLEPTPKS